MTLSLRGGVRQRASEREKSRNGRRIRAAGPSHLTVHPRDTKLVKRLAVEQDVQNVGLRIVLRSAHGRGPQAMSAFQDDILRAHLVQPPCRVARTRKGVDAPAAERLGLGKIRRHDKHAGQEFRYERLHAVRVEQARSGRRREHGIEDDERQFQVLDCSGDRFGDGGRRQHAYLGRLNLRVGGNRLNLCRDEVCGERRDRRDPLSVLRGDRGDGRGSVDAEGFERSKVGLDTGAAARIAPGNCQSPGHTLSLTLMRTTLLDVMIARPEESRAVRSLQRLGAVLFVTVLTIVAAQISIPLPFTPVPFTFQPMVVLVGAAALGARLGAGAQVLYLALGLAGVPVFAASAVLPQGGLRLLGPTGGYLLAYPIAAFVAGWLAERGFDRRYATAVLAMVCGLAIVFAGGVSWLALAPVGRASGWAGALAAGFYPFIAADVVKLLVAAAVMPSLWRLTGVRD